MSYDKYSDKAIRRLLALLALSTAGVGGIESSGINFERARVNLPPGVHSQPQTDREQHDAARSGLSMPHTLGGFPSIQPIIQPIFKPPDAIRLRTEQHVVPNPHTPSKHRWNPKQNSPGGREYFRGRAGKSHPGGGAVFYHLPKIKTSAQNISNKELVRRMKEFPKEPVPVRLTQDGLREYLNNHKMPDLRETIRLLNVPKKGPRK